MYLCVNWVQAHRTQGQTGMGTLRIRGIHRTQKIQMNKTWGTQDM